MATEMQNRIAQALSAISDRTFTGFGIAIMSDCVKQEYKQRKLEGIVINNKLASGRMQIRERTAAIVNKELNIKINQDHILKYKRVLADDYTERTGRCAWGFKDLRIRWGYDPETGLEMEES